VCVLCQRPDFSLFTTNQNICVDDSFVMRRKMSDELGYLLRSVERSKKQQEGTEQKIKESLRKLKRLPLDVAFQIRK
jgi:hypothetical protein